MSQEKIKKIFIHIDRIVHVFAVGIHPCIVYTSKRTYVNVRNSDPKWTKNGVYGYYTIQEGRIYE